MHDRESNAKRRPWLYIENKKKMKRWTNEYDCLFGIDHVRCVWLVKFKIKYRTKGTFVLSHRIKRIRMSVYIRKKKRSATTSLHAYIHTYIHISQDIIYVKYWLLLVYAISIFISLISAWKSNWNVILTARILPYRYTRHSISSLLLYTWRTY